MTQAKVRLASGMAALLRLWPAAVMRPGRFTRLARLVVFGLAVAFASGAAAHAEVTLKFGVYATDSRGEVERQFRRALVALEIDMSKRLGQDVKIIMEISPRYEGGLEDLVQGRVDFARLGPASYVLGKESQPELSILAIESSEGSKTFNGIICVRRDSSIRSLADLKGRSFAFGDDQSTIGRYLSQLYLAQHGVRAEDLSRYDYLDRHDKVGIAVGRGEYDAGALKESTFNQLVKRGVPIRALTTFPNVTKPWVARAGMDPRIETALRESLLNLRDASALAALKADGLLPGSDEDFAAIRQSIQQNEEFFTSRPATN